MAANANLGFVGRVSRRRLTAWAVAVLGVLLIPLVGMQVSDGWKWGIFDFVIAGILLFGAALAYELLASLGGTTAYRVGAGVACATGLVLLWINAAVGIIGDGPVNLLYLGVLAVGFVGALIARFQPRGMALACFAAAVAQMLVPVIALVIWKAGGESLLTDPSSPHPPFDPGVGPVFVLNGVFAMLFAGAGMMFRSAACGWTEGETGR